MSPRLPHIATTLASCADTFIGAAVTAWATVDPAGSASDAPPESLRRLVAAQLGLNEEATPAPGWTASERRPLDAAAPHH
jgi:flagellar biosynthesis protein FlhG